MFKNCIQLAEDVYLYSQFITKREAEDLYTLAYSLYPWETKLSKKAEELSLIKERIQAEFFPNYDLYEHNAFQCLIEGENMYEHTDTPSDPRHRDEDGQRWSRIVWGTILYINDDYSGGEIYYPELNIEYKPQAGDLLIHAAHVVHGVRKVTKGIRFAYSNFATIKRVQAQEQHEDLE